MSLSGSVDSVIPEIGAGSWRPQVPWDPTSHPGLVGLALSDGKLLLHLLRHYPFIVHFGVTFWRKILIMLARDPETSGQFRPCLDNSLNFTPASPVAPAASRTAAQHGMVGWLPKVSMTLPEGFLESGQRLTTMRMVAASQTGPLKNNRPSEFDTYLSWAIRNNQLDVVAILMKQLNIKLGKGVWDGWWPPLQLAATHGHTEMVRYFISQGAKVDEQSQLGCFSALHDAAEQGHEDIVQILIQDGGAEVNAKGEDDQTPLHHAASSGHVEVSKMLVAHGASLDAKCRRGLSPLQHAERAHSPKMVRLLSPILSPTSDSSRIDGHKTWPVQSAVRG